MAQLWEAILFGNMNLAEELVETGIDLNGPLYCHPEKPGFLHAMIWKANEKLAFLIIERGADVNVRDANGNSVLHAAIACNCSIDFIKVLLNKGARIDAVNLQNTDVLMLAASQSTAAQLLPVLIKADFVDDATRERRGLKALFYLFTMDEDNTKAIEAVLALGLPINGLCENGQSLLHNAVLSEKIDKIQLLLRHGADVNTKSIDKMPPLFVALTHQKSTTVKILIEKGASIHDSCDNGLFPIHVATHSASYENIQLLLRLGVDVNVIDKSGRTAFSIMKFNATNADSVVLFMKHFALLTAKGMKVRESDLDIIRRADLQNIFQGYLRELQKAKQVKIYDDISFFSFLDKNVRKLSLLMKNRDLVKKYSITSTEMLFPHYSALIKLKYKIAEKRQILLASKLTFVEKLFNGLPDLVLERISYYLCHDKLKNLELKYILSIDQESIPKKELNK